MTIYLATLVTAPFPGEMNVENIDVFCEKGVFEVEDSQRILEVADICCCVKYIMNTRNIFLCRLLLCQSIK